MATDAPPQSFLDVWQALHASKHTGPVLVHVAEGVPKVIEVPSEPTRIAVAKQPKEPLTSAPRGAQTRPHSSIS